jgi:ubiquinone/menaquinone biosynthesis C-methylase UbiE/ADP-ribose pyrophosphatase YjhB (NUDIX family)/uncharacterized protein YbaR (Trm112 family)
MMNQSANHFQSPLSRWLDVLRCPECGERLQFKNFIDGRELACRKCEAIFPVGHGIPALIRRERQTAIEKYAQDYAALRLAEGWASAEPGFYEALPHNDVTGKHSQEWKWRAASLMQMQSWLHRAFARTRNSSSPAGGLRLLDAGAGCGWMSRELAKQHQVVAVDTDAGDHGLNAIPIDKRKFLSVQGELDNLPLASGSFHVVIAAASLHHLANPKTLFQQAARVLRLDGWLVVMDSPTYPTRLSLEAAGERSREYFSNIGFAHLAEYYSGIVEEIFTQQNYFNFTRHRRDFSRKDYALKRVRETLGHPAGARFPIWIGRRRGGPDELAPRGRYRAGAVIRHGNDVLMTRARHQHVEFWHTPGGTMQPGEPPHQAVRRRLLAECNLDIELQSLLGEYFFPAHREWCYIAASIEPSMRDQCAEFWRGKDRRQAELQWLPIERLAELDIRPAGLKWDLLAFLR